MLKSLLHAARSGHESKLLPDRRRLSWLPTADRQLATSAIRNWAKCPLLLGALSITIALVSPGHASGSGVTWSQPNEAFGVREPARASAAKSGNSAPAPVSDLLVTASDDPITVQGEPFRGKRIRVFRIPDSARDPDGRIALESLRGQDS